MYDLNQIRQFLKIVECGTMLKAADELNMTQPGLSRSMRRLEDELSVPLFVRSANSITLNENGKKASELFADFYKTAIDIQKELSDFAKSQKTIRVLSPSPTLFAELKRRLAISNPNQNVITELSRYDEMVRELREEKCQLIQVSVPVSGDDVYNAVFDEESLYLLLPESHRFATRKNGIRLSELDGETVLALPETGYWNGVAKKLIPHSHFIFQKERTDFEVLLSASTLPTFVTDAMLSQYGSFQNRVAIPLLDDYLNLTVYCCCLKKNREFFEQFFALASGL